MSKNVLIAGVQVPYTRGGAEILVESLHRELQSRGYNVDVVQLPMSMESREDVVRAMSQWRGLDLKRFSGNEVDVLIATKFPTYLVQHPRKSIWLVHQYRQLYDLFGSRFGERVRSVEDEAFRQMVYDLDRVAFAEARTIQTISPNVARRLGRYLGIELKENGVEGSSAPESKVIHGGVLLPPLPLCNNYYSVPYVQPPYILSVGRICHIKRVDLIVKSLPIIHSEISLKVVGLPDQDGIMEYLENEISKHHLWHRVQFLGRVSKEELLKLYAESFAVYYAPFDEDYGYVTLEAFASGKPVITASDSGGVLEFVSDAQNGLVAEPSESSIAQVVNRLHQDVALYETLSRGAALSVHTNTWDEICSKLCE